MACSFSTISCPAKPSFCKSVSPVLHYDYGAPLKAVSSAGGIGRDSKTAVKARRPSSLASRMCNALESLIDFAESRYIKISDEDDPLRCNNFVPVVSECPPLPCELEMGSLPEFLEGVYLRNGPNKCFGSAQAAHHFFDGDGLLHALAFRGGKATYSCQFVRTSRYIQEAEAGRALFPKVFASSRSGLAGLARIVLALLRHLLGVADLSEGIGLGNSGLVYHHGKLLALSEDDLPHVLDIQPNGDVHSRRRYSFNEATYESGSATTRRIEMLLTGSGVDAAPWAMTSHPKIDPDTGEMFAFGYNPLFPPHLTFFRVSKDGVKSKNVAIKLPEPSMIHDFGLTKNYVIFPDVQVVFRPLRLLQGQSPILFDAQKIPRFGVLPRYAEDDSSMRWFDVPGCNCFHLLNSWEEGENEIVLLVPVVANVSHVLRGDLQNFSVTLMEVRLNLATGGSSQTPICEEMNLEMGSLNRNYWCEKNKYLYMGVAGQFPNLCGVVKVDLQERRVVASRSFDEGIFASEPFFVPRRDRSCATVLIGSEEERGFKDEEEDEGCLVSLVHNELTCTSRLIIMDPKSPTLESIASIRIPRRVPYGFHGLFVPQQLLN